MDPASGVRPRGPGLCLSWNEPSSRKPCWRGAQSLTALTATYQLPKSNPATLRADRDNFRTTLRWLLTAYGT